jgi:hypothetical protein
VNGRELDGLREKASKKTNGAQRTSALHPGNGSQKKGSVVFCASEIGEVAREIQHHYREALSKSSQHFYKKFAGINKLTAAFEI